MLGKKGRKKKPKESDATNILTYDYGDKINGDDIINYDVIGKLPKLEFLNNTSQVVEVASETGDIIDDEICSDTELADDIEDDIGGVSANIKLESESIKLESESINIDDSDEEEDGMETKNVLKKPMIPDVSESISNDVSNQGEWG